MGSGARTKSWTQALSPMLFVRTPDPDGWFLVILNCRRYLWGRPAEPVIAPRPCPICSHKRRILTGLSHAVLPRSPT